MKRQIKNLEEERSKLQERSIGYILRHTRWIWSDINNYSTKTSSGRRLTLVNLKLHYIQSASFFMLSRDNSGSSNSSFPNSSWVVWDIDWKGTSRTAGPFDPSASLLQDPPVLEAPSAATGVCSGLGSLDFSAVSTFGKLEAGVSINPITGDSGGWSTSSFRTTRHPVAEVLNLIFFMCREILDPSQARFWIRKLRQNRIKSIEYYILTGWQQDEELFSATNIRESPFTSCCHQNQHLQKSEAYNTSTYNFSAERSQEFIRRSK